MNCSRCGAENQDGTRFCSSCGAPLIADPAAAQPRQEIPQEYMPEPPTTSRAQALIKSLCTRLRVSGILLLITGILMLIGSVASAVAGIVFLFQQNFSLDLNSILMQYEGYGFKVGDIPFLSDMDPGTLHIVSLIVVIAYFVCCAVVIAMGIVNVVFACRTFASIKAIKKDTVYITDRFGTTGKGVAMLVLNILFGGGILGIIGSIFAIVARGYVKSHFVEFNAIDNNAVVEETSSFRH